MRRIGVVGARIHGRPDQVRALVMGFAGQDVTLVSGGAPGVDDWAEEAARDAGLPVRVHHPSDLTRDAFLERDRAIAHDRLDELHAFPWWGARGTHYTSRVAREAGVRVVEHRPEPLVDVWTCRVGSGDPDELIITRQMASARADEFRGGEVARLLGDHDPYRRLYELVVDMEERGRSLLEIQRKTVLPSPISLGAPWTPSWEILKPALKALEDAKRMRDVTGREKEANEAADRAWERYLRGPKGDEREGLLAELRASQRDKAIAWGWLLARRPANPLRNPPPAPSRVVLACHCANPARCHRTVVARMLGDMGATVRGELPQQPKKDAAGDAPLFTRRPG